ncbi:hypothetical protein MKW98_022096 [Papaver atlanticum]|uniref:GIR1-like zinc ribbon domain-containing protein n=1 Tax=Papaver atlanticum TaxID=357466 RepID=A0AAD4XYV0_9MAGN|nr:hypothetical protein MKW98_022096 [Papaver atlanticum]
MSERKEKKDIDCMSSKIDLKLDLSPPVLEQLIITITGNSSTLSPTSSCVSSDKKRLSNDSSSDPEETTTMLSDMVLVGCRYCYLYVLLAKGNLRCPNCKCSNFIEIPDYSTKSNKKSRKN